MCVSRLLSYVYWLLGCVGLFSSMVMGVTHVCRSELAFSCFEQALSGSKLAVSGYIS